jgi:hypothetical protein
MSRRRIRPGARQPGRIAGAGGRVRLLRTRLWRQYCRTGGNMTKPPQPDRNLAEKRRRRLLRQGGHGRGECLIGLIHCPGGNECGR